MEFPNLHTLTYVPGIAEHAKETHEYIRKNFSRRNFILAIDLPYGFEQTVLAAAKRLPVISLILDITGRGIPVVPTHAPMEAVRLFLEYGMDMHFVDSSLPVTGDIGEWYRFVEMAQYIGVKEILKNPQNFGISLEELFGVKKSDNPVEPYHFAHLSQEYRKRITAILPEEKNRYIDSRNRLMAHRLKRLLDSGNEVIFVCNELNALRVTNYLSEDIDCPIDDKLVLPSLTCTISRENVHKVTHEVPHFMYLFDLYRNGEFTRFDYIKKLFLMTRTIEYPDDIKACIQYSMKLALTEGQLYPDTYLMTVAAQAIIDDFYAGKVLKEALTYPYADISETNCPGIEGFLDYNLQRVPHRTIVLKKENERDRDYTKRKKMKRWSWSWYSRWLRHSSHYETEKKLYYYLLSNFSFKNKKKKFRPKKFCSGLKYGIDFRATLRKSAEGRDLYVKEKEKTSKAAYIIDYGGTANGAIFVDRLVKGIGTALIKGDHYTINTMVLFPVLDCEATDIFARLETRNALQSSIDVALEHVENLIIFSDAGKNFMNRMDISPKIYRMYPLKTIPGHLLGPYHEFDIVQGHLRYNPLGD
jgi:hypothetical protein